MTAPRSEGSGWIRVRDKVVVALGGNALVRGDHNPTIETQFRNVERAMVALAPMFVAGHPMVITHGNGFQVGSALIRVEEALGRAYPLPLEICVASTQGEIGYMVEQTLQNLLLRRGLRRPVVSVLSQVVVDRRDPEFRAPSKPVGPWFGAAEARRLHMAGVAVVEDSRRGWRKLVPSPRPIDIDEPEMIDAMVKKGAIVVTCGGGGVPVLRSPKGRLKGVDAVIDKDLASAVLAERIRAKHLIILTGEPEVYVDFGRPSQRALRTASLREMEQYLAEGQFPPGSMGPKVEAALQFIRAGGRSVVITATERLQTALRGRAGTIITRSGRLPA